MRIIGARRASPHAHRHRHRLHAAPLLGRARRRRQAPLRRRPALRGAASPGGSPACATSSCALRSPRRTPTRPSPAPSPTRTRSRPSTRWHDAGHFIHVTSHRAGALPPATERVAGRHRPAATTTCTAPTTRSAAASSSTSTSSSTTARSTSRARSSTASSAATIVHPWNRDVCEEEGRRQRRRLARRWPPRSRAACRRLQPARHDRARPGPCGMIDLDAQRIAEPSLAPAGEARPGHRPAPATCRASSPSARSTTGVARSASRASWTAR